METLEGIERLAKRHAEARDVLIERMRRLERALDDVRREHMRGIKGAVGTAARTESELRAAIDDGRELFAKPRTRVLHGLKVGMRKRPGRLSWRDVGQVLKLIRKHHAGDVDLFIRTKEEPVKDALAQMTAAELKRLGIQVVEACDVTEVRAVDSAVDRWVETMLQGFRDELEQVEGEAA